MRNWKLSEIQREWSEQFRTPHLPGRTMEHKDTCRDK